MLVGRAFYESIGSPRFILAPMVDQSEFAWRMLSRSFLPSESRGSLLSYSPMFHARLFSEDPKYRDRMFEPLRTSLPDKHSSMPHDVAVEQIRLDGNPAMDRPLFVQFCANDPEALLEAARHVQPYCDAIDLNLGCPQGIARKGHYGAFLQEDWDTIYKLINTLKNGLSIPVTAKFRILESKEKTLEYAKMMLSAGASILTVHGRRREQKGHNTGVADWSYIRYLRENLPPETVLFANGNILRHSDIADCMRETGVDGVMSAEGNLSDPTIFAGPPVEKHNLEYWTGRDGRGGYRMDAVFRRYMDIIYRHVMESEVPERAELYAPKPQQGSQSNGDSRETMSTSDISNALAGTKRSLQEDEESSNVAPLSKKQRKMEEKKRRKDHAKQVPKTSSPNLLAMKAHLFNMLRPLISKHHRVRDALARASPGDLKAYEDVLKQVEEVTATGLDEYERGVDDGYLPLDHDDGKKLSSEPGENTGVLTSRDTVKECRRPWWICQPYVRPLPTEAIQNGALTLSSKDKSKLDDEARLAQASGVKPNGATKEEKISGEPSKSIEVPADGLVCG